MKDSLHTLGFFVSRDRCKQRQAGVQSPDPDILARSSLSFHIESILSPLIGSTLFSFTNISRRPGRIIPLSWVKSASSASVNFSRWRPPPEILLHKFLSDRITVLEDLSEDLANSALR